MIHHEFIDYWKNNFSFKNAKEISYDLMSEKHVNKQITRESLKPLVQGKLSRDS